MSERPNDDLGFSLPEPARLSRTRAVAIGFGALVVLGGAFAYGWVPRHRAQKELVAETAAAGGAALRVEVVRPKVGASDRALSLPGNVQPLEETTIYARASGYVRRWNADIGDKVAAGALLAELDTPELDQQLAESRAQLTRAEAGIEQAKANLAFAKQSLGRIQNMFESGVASAQEVDQRRTEATVAEANLTVALANVDAQKANIRRLTELRSFARITAPFAGTITTRTVQRGDLVTAGNANPLFKLAAMDPMRVFVQVPQDLAPSVRVGLDASVAVREFPSKPFAGKVAHAAGALDTATRTMTTEIRVPNPGGELLAGMYAQVSISLPVPHKVYELPATAVLTDAAGVRVAVVTPAGTLALVPVVLERDTGPTVQIASGLEGDEKVVRIASAELVAGRPVDVAE